jgi:hypothetical protein
LALDQHRLFSTFSLDISGCKPDSIKSVNNYEQFAEELFNAAVFPRAPEWPI